MKKIGISVTITTLLIMSTLALALQIQQVKAEELEYIYINAAELEYYYIYANGSISEGAPISTFDNITYTLTNSTNRSSIVILRDNITFDGNKQNNFAIEGYNSTHRIGRGIDLTGRRNVTTKNVAIKWFHYGIYLNGSSNCTLYNNEITKGNSSYLSADSSGIYLLNSSYNDLTGNRVETHLEGIILKDSDRNRLFNNTANINGDVTDGTGFGIHLMHSSYNNLTLNKALYNHDGIGLDGYSNNNDLLNNLLEKNGVVDYEGEGIGIYRSSYNTVSGNDITDNNLGLLVDVYATYNLFYHNNLMQDQQISLDESATNSSFDNGYPSGGNYWSDYSGLDEKSGPNQDQPKSDGIGDIPYQIPILDRFGNIVGFDYDNYPLMNPWINPDVNRDGIVDIFDLVLVANAYGSKPGDPKWNPDADLNKDGIIDIFDLVRIANAYGEKYYVPGSSSSSGSGSRTLEETTIVSVYPDEVTVYRHESFCVNVTVTDVTDLYGWEFKLYWNSTILNCTNAQIHAPDIWGENVFEAGDGIQNDFNATHGRYFKAMSALYPTSSFNGSIAIVTLTFETKAAENSTLDLEDTKLSDSQARAITHATADGSVTVLFQTRYMRGDKHTVNNLEAYKLSTSQSATQITYSDEASGAGTVYWGIRVWKRNANGTETEITGATPVAQVSRSSDGEGMQSNTWSCPQTSLQETDAIVARVYMKFGSGSWQQCSTFITEQLEAAQLDPTQWAVHYYTWRYYASYEKTTYGFFKWGTSAYNSRIANFEYT